MIISILNQKGGVGKTTLAVNLTRAYVWLGKKALLVDSDHQGSAQKWHERSGGTLIDMTCLPMNTLDKDVLKFTNTYERIVIDGIPRVSPLTICAIKAADLILIPVQPSPYDIWSTEDLVRNVKDRIEMTEGKTKAAFIVSRKIVGTKVGREIESELEQLALPVLKCGTSQRVDYITSVDKGMSVLDGEFKNTAAYLEIMSIAKEIESILSGTHQNKETEEYI